LWPASDELVDRERLGAIDADTYATSLREAVEACLHAAA
jgi:hypothetical protein